MVTILILQAQLKYSLLHKCYLGTTIPQIIKQSVLPLNFPITLPFTVVLPEFTLWFFKKITSITTHQPKWLKSKKTMLSIAKDVEHQEFSYTPLMRV